MAGAGPFGVPAGLLVGGLSVCARPDGGGEAVHPGGDRCGRNGQKGPPFTAWLTHYHPQSHPAAPNCAKRHASQDKKRAPLQAA